MSASDPFRSSPPPGPRDGCTVLIIVLAILGTMSLCCIALGVAGFVFYLAMGKEQRANWQPPAILHLFQCRLTLSTAVPTAAREFWNWSRKPCGRVSRNWWPARIGHVSSTARDDHQAASPIRC